MRNARSLPSHPGEVEFAWANSQALCLWLYKVVEGIVPLSVPAGARRAGNDLDLQIRILSRLSRPYEPHTREGETRILRRRKASAQGL